MQKLIENWAQEGSEKARLALLRYLDRHFMAECMATPAQARWIAAARAGRL